MIFHDQRFPRFAGRGLENWTLRGWFPDHLNHWNDANHDCVGICSWKVRELPEILIFSYMVTWLRLTLVRLPEGLVYACDSPILLARFFGHLFG